MDQLATLQSLLDSNRYFNGQGQIYEIAGDLVIPDNTVAEHFKVKQLDQTSSRRSIKKIGGCNIALNDVGIDRGPDPTIGDVTNSAGMWISGVDGVRLDNIDVTGNGPGSGVFLYGLNKPNLGRIVVHDMQFSAATDPGSEQLVGIWVNTCTRFELSKPDVSNLISVIGGVTRPFQTDGIDASGCHDFTIATPIVSMCGEGIDISGTNGNARFSIIGGHIYDIDSWGVKLANSAGAGLVSNVIVRSAGFGGFTVSGPSQQNIPRCENHKFSFCKALNIGSNGRWAAQNTSGFSIITSLYDTAWPMGVEFIFCEARDTQANPTMKYGYIGQPTITPSNPNRRINCESFGHSQAEVLGNFS